MTLPQVAPFSVTSLTVSVYRAPVERPVRNAFGGMMTNRPAVIVRAESGDTVGYGEIFCNFPTCGAEHRARLLESVFRPWVVGRTFPSPAAAFEELTTRSASRSTRTRWPSCARRQAPPARRRTRSNAACSA